MFPEDDVDFMSVGRQFSGIPTRVFEKEKTEASWWQNNYYNWKKEHDKMVESGLHKEVQETKAMDVVPIIEEELKKYPDMWYAINSLYNEMYADELAKAKGINAQITDQDFFELPANAEMKLDLISTVIGSYPNNDINAVAMRQFIQKTDDEWGYKMSKQQLDALNKGITIEGEKFTVSPSAIEEAAAETLAKQVTLEEGEAKRKDTMGELLYRQAQEELPDYAQQFENLSKQKFMANLTGQDKLAQQIQAMIDYIEMKRAQQKLTLAESGITYKGTQYKADKIAEIKARKMAMLKRADMVKQLLGSQ